MTDIWDILILHDKAELPVQCFGAVALRPGAPYILRGLLKDSSCRTMTPLPPLNYRSTEGRENRFLYHPLRSRALKQYGTTRARARAPLAPKKRLTDKCTSGRIKKTSHFIASLRSTLLL